MSNLAKTICRMKQLDHLVLTVTDIYRSKEFYQNVMGMLPKQINGRWSLHFGMQKLNLHLHGHEFEPKVKHPQPGSNDLCFLTECPLNDFIEHLKALEVKIVEGPVRRTGAQGPILSVYFRDPDLNLIEVANPLTE
jgi:catechol 2,3-dioxygenase-like lactoylglutathione lyase family enzyme